MLPLIDRICLVSLLNIETAERHVAVQVVLVGFVVAAFFHFQVNPIVGFQPKNGSVGSGLMVTWITPRHNNGAAIVVQ